MIEKPFAVVVVESFMDGVNVYLKPQDLSMPDASTVLEPAPQSEDEKVAARMVQTIMVEVKKTLGEIPMRPPPLSPFALRIYLTNDEYEKLGKPTVGDTIQMQLQTPKEGECVERKSGET